MDGFSDSDIDSWIDSQEYINESRGSMRVKETIVGSQNGSVWLHNQTDIKVVKEYEDSQLPTKAHQTDACWDLYLHSVESVIEYLEDGQPSQVYTCDTGVRLGLPRGTHVRVYPRSSISKTPFFLANSVGIIDNDYTGIIYVKFRTFGRHTFPFRKGDRIAQFELAVTHPAELTEVDALEVTIRGDGGFGSSGV